MMQPLVSMNVIENPASRLIDDEHPKDCERVLSPLKWLWRNQNVSDS
jgi:hypothetical protein